MRAINGKELIDRLDQLKAEIWVDGERITVKISEHPAFKGILETKASLYDLQLEPHVLNELTFISPVTNEPTGISYLQPKTKEDLVKRRTMMELGKTDQRDDGEKSRLSKLSYNGFCIFCSIFKGKG